MAQRQPMTAPASSSGETRLPIVAIVLTFNEELNLEACLASLSGWVEHLVVVDSGSTDRTLDIARRFAADIVFHPFESHARQWAWALEATAGRARWVLGLDADQQVTPALRASIAEALARDDDSGPVGYYVNRRQMFRGRWIRHGGYYPKYLLKLFRAGHGAVDDLDLVDHHFRVSGPVARLAGDLIEDNQNEARITEWIHKHNRYARAQAQEELLRLAHGGGADGRLFGHPDERVQWLKQQWRKLPLYARPFLYFVYRYVLRLGFLDGKEGFVFHFMQALWYRLLVDINREELARIGASARTPDPATTADVVASRR
jgi:glycosyltransferase involved in cell wall biosynthesis